MQNSIKQPQKHPYEWAYNCPPVGRWQTSLGTGSQIIGEVLTLTKNGTGELFSFSPMTGRETLPIIWRFVSPGKMQLTIYYEEFHEDYKNLDEVMETVSYRLDWIVTDIGKVPVLVNTDDNNFWTLSGPIQFLGDE